MSSAWMMSCSPSGTRVVQKALEVADAWRVTMVVTGGGLEEGELRSCA